MFDLALLNCPCIIETDKWSHTKAFWVRLEGCRFVPQKITIILGFQKAAHTTLNTIDFSRREFHNFQYTLPFVFNCLVLSFIWIGRHSKWGLPNKKKTSKQYNIYAFCFPAVRPKINASISPWSICNGLGRLPYHWINWWWDEHSAVESCGEEAYVDNAAHKSLISLLRLKPFSFQCFAYILACGNCSKSKWYRKIRPKLIDRIGIEFVRSFLSHSVLFTIAVRTHLAEPIANIFIFYAKRIDLVWFQATELVDSTILRQLGSSFDGVGSELTYLAAQNRFSMWKFTIIRLIKWSRGRCHSHDTPTRKANAWFVIWMSRAPSAVSVMATLQFYMNNR